MIKLICFVVRHPSLTVHEFHERWLVDHAPKVAANSATTGRLVGYEINRRKTRDYDRTDTPYDGVAVQTYDSWDAFTAMFAEPGYAALMEDEQTLFDTAAMQVIFTEPEHVVIDGPAARPDGVTKLFAALHRRAGSTVEEFREHWRTSHASVNRDTPSIARHILRYEQNPALRGGGLPNSEFDGVTIQWFATAREFFAMATEPEYTTVVEPDEAKLLERSTLTWILTEAEQRIV